MIFVFLNNNFKDYTKGVESFTISTINVMKYFSTNYMEALGLNQAYMLLKLRNIII